MRYLINDGGTRWWKVTGVAAGPLYELYDPPGSRLGRLAYIAHHVLIQGPCESVLRVLHKLGF